MKILHTGDWHIGKLVRGVYMTSDQEYMLEELIKLIEKEKPEVLVIAGDIYDRSIPPIEAVELLDKTLSSIVMNHNIKVIAIAGNHDSPDRLGFANKMLSDKGLYIRAKISDEIEPVVIEDEFGVVNFYPIPFAEPVIVKEIYKDKTIKNNNSAMRVIIEKIKDNMDYSARNICIAHAFVRGNKELERSESERPLSIGGAEYVDVQYFEDFNYVALGHLHGPQKVKHEYIRYSGSLLKYSFSDLY